MEADEDGRGLHLQPPNTTQPVSPVPMSGEAGEAVASAVVSSTSEATAAVQALPNLEDIDDDLGINFNHLLDLPFNLRVPDINQSNDTDSETWQPSQPTSHQLDLNLDALLSNTGKTFVNFRVPITV